MTDDLEAPLGRKKKPKTRTRRRLDLRSLPLARGLFGLIGLIVLALVARVLITDDPQGGRPIAEVGVSAARTNDIAATVATEPPADTPSVTIAETVPETGGPSITTIGDDVPDADSLGASMGVESLTEFGVLPDLVEETQNGPIPQMGPDGTTPFAAYARASITPASANGKPLVALIMTGMGLSESGTLDAIDKLPDNITLAFAPYGRSLQRTGSAARAGGHELMLEVPLEPFDYPQNDPGPQTLLTGQTPRANLDRLFWLLARLGGYTGVINHMGARFTASAADFSPIMEELGTRGLGYFDDGSSNRSLAENIAAKNKVPFRRADIQVDATPSRSAILSALNELEETAVKNGSAVGIATALPVSIQTIAEWARELEDRGLLLVPASALMNTPR